MTSPDNEREYTPVKLPSLNLFTGDWRKDPQLRVCSPAARGIWIDVLCIMQDCPRRGYLEIVEGEPMELRTLAKLIGDSEQEIFSALRELERNGVSSKDQNGTLFSRRMVKDEEKRRADFENGKRGGQYGSLGGRPRKLKLEKENDSPPAPTLPNGATEAHREDVAVKPNRRKRETVVTGEHQSFIDAWSDGYKKQFSRKYKFNGGSDGTAVKSLLATGATAEELLHFAALAWTHPTWFNCKQAATIRGFNGRFNEILSELETNGNSNGNGKPKSDQLRRAEYDPASAENIARRRDFSRLLEKLSPRV